MPDVDVFAGHDSVEGRFDDGVAQVELGGFQRGFGLLDHRPVVVRMVLAVDAQGGLGLHQLVVGEPLGGERHAERGVRLVVVFDWTPRPAP